MKSLGQRILRQGLFKNTKIFWNHSHGKIHIQLIENKKNIVAFFLILCICRAELNRKILRVLYNILQYISQWTCVGGVEFFSKRILNIKCEYIGSFSWSCLFFNLAYFFLFYSLHMTTIIIISCIVVDNKPWITF